MAIETCIALPCAWCLDEQSVLEIEPSNGSHGICDSHAEQVYESYAAKRVQTLLDEFHCILSYVERFHDGREVF